MPEWADGHFSSLVPSGLNSEENAGERLRVNSQPIFLISTRPTDRTTDPYKWTRSVGPERISLS